MQLTDSNGSIIFYWKLFADFEAISDKKAASVYTYGKKVALKEVETQYQNKTSSRESEIRRARQGQGVYREKLLSECPFCPITMINDERLLIASHIKPWAVSTDKEKIDHKNGLCFLPCMTNCLTEGS